MLLSSQPLRCEHAYAWVEVLIRIINDHLFILTFICNFPLETASNEFGPAAPFDEQHGTVTEYDTALLP